MNDIEQDEDGDVRGKNRHKIIVTFNISPFLTRQHAYRPFGIVRRVQRTFEWGQRTKIEEKKMLFLSRAFKDTYVFRSNANFLYSQVAERETGCWVTSFHISCNCISLSSPQLAFLVVAVWWRYSRSLEWKKLRVSTSPATWDNITRYSRVYFRRKYNNTIFGQHWIS